MKNTCCDHAIVQQHDHSTINSTFDEKKEEESSTSFLLLFRHNKITLRTIEINIYKKHIDSLNKWKQTDTQSVKEQFTRSLHSYKYSLRSVFVCVRVCVFFVFCFFNTYSKESTYVVLNNNIIQINIIFKIDIIYIILLSTKIQLKKQNNENRNSIYNLY